MQRFSQGILLALILATGPSGAEAAPPPGAAQSATAETAAQEFITLLVQDKFDDAVKRFDATMQKALPAAQLQAAWRSATALTGAFQKFERARTARVAGSEVVETPCVFEKSVLVTRISFDKEKKIAGLYFLSPTKRRDLGDEGPSAELQTSNGTIHGTFDLPAGKGPWPVVLIIAGSGPTDRDGNSPQMENDSLKLVGKALAASGIAALRYDKRGVGQSAPTGTDETKLRFENYVDDAAGWVKQLRADQRFNKIAILGHSEGSLIGLLAAKQAPVDALISIAGAGKNAVVVLREQLKPKLSGELLTKSSHILDELQAGRRVEDVPPELFVIFRPSVQPYLISWFKYDPSKEVAQLMIPILIVQGTNDIQVTVDDAKLLAASNQSARSATIENMNHVLKHTTEKSLLGQLKAYSDPSLPLAPKLMDAVLPFLRETLPGK
jgi:pimeloyl-ACP methyl ester carboxylesterase